MVSGRIVKALSGFYYVKTEDGILVCKARGRFRLDGTSPLVGDWVQCQRDQDGTGRIEHVEERRNWFIRPAAANLDALVFVASGVNPVTDPYLIDRVSVIAAESNCELIVCVNKSDLEPAEALFRLYYKAGFSTVRTSAETGEGLDSLRRLISGKTAAFTGNSGVGKSSLLNRLFPDAQMATAEVSEKLGRGKHTTRHVELFELDDATFIADTPGYASFELEMMQAIRAEELPEDFSEFAPYLGQCRFLDCAHLKEPGCAVTQAVAAGEISESRYRSYIRLHELCAQQKFWERRVSNIIRTRQNGDL